MILKSRSCTVSPHIQCNHATNTLNFATSSETTAQLPSLLTLATGVLERNKCNQSRNSNATQAFPEAPPNSELLKHETDERFTATALNSQSCAVASPIERNYATGITCMTCGYNKPSCTCKLPPSSEDVTCDSCSHFTPDQIGDGTGIGHCNQGVTWTRECNGRMPLYRFADRHCVKFSKLIS